MQVVLIAPGRDLNSWQRALHQIDPEGGIAAWPDTGNTDGIEVAILWNHPQGVLSSFPNLRLISSMGAGVDHILRDPLLPKDIPIMRIVDKQLSDAMSNYIIMAILNYQRNLHHHLSNQKKKIWDQKLAYKFTLNIGFLGMGLLASDAARKLDKLGFQVRGYSKSQKNILGIKNYHGASKLDPFLSGLDVLVNLLPLTEQTRGILNIELFTRLTKPALLINAARGEQLVEQDLVQALDQGLLSQAYLDVFQHEPLPSEHPFWSHPKVFMTPHIAAITNPKNAVKQIARNYKRLQNHQELTHLVDFSKQY